MVTMLDKTVQLPKPIKLFFIEVLQLQVAKFQATFARGTPAKDFASLESFIAFDPHDNAVTDRFPLTTRALALTDLVTFAFTRLFLSSDGEKGITQVNNCFSDTIE